MAAIDFEFPLLRVTRTTLNAMIMASNTAILAMRERISHVCFTGSSELVRCLLEMGVVEIRSASDC